MSNSELVQFTKATTNVTVEFRVNDIKDFLFSTITQNDTHALRGRGLSDPNIVNFGSLTPNKLHLWLVWSVDRTLPFLLKCSLTGRRFY